MINEQRFAELPTHSRMAWSTRPVWDRRPVESKRRDRRPDMGRSRRYRTHGDGRHRSLDLVEALARSESLVVDDAQLREEAL